MRIRFENIRYVDDKTATQPNSLLVVKTCEGYDVMQGILKWEEKGLRDLMQRYQRTDTVSSKDKAVPLQAWSGLEGSRKLRFPDYVRTVQDGGKVVRPKHRPPLPPGNAPGTYFCLKAESTPGP